jgi:tellurite resistance protein TehA-like permease
MSWGGAGLSLANFQGVSGTFHDILQWVGVVVWIWNCIYWIVFQGLFLARAIMYVHEHHHMPQCPLWLFAAVLSLKKKQRT